MNAKIMQAIATLQEEVQMKTLEKGNNVNEVTIADFSYSEYPQDGFLKRVSYGNGDTYVFDLEYINRVSKDMKKNLVGGEGINNSITLFRNVYGINKDFTVWYIDENGKMYGANKIIEIPLNVNDKIKTSNGLKEALGITEEVTVGDVRGKSILTLDGSLISEENKITDLEELSLFPNLTELTIKNLSLTNINGLQYCPNLKKLWFDNTISNDYKGLSFCLNVEELYPINDSVTTDNIFNMTNNFGNMKELKTVKIENNDKLTMIPALSTLGGVKTLYIDKNKNLTNIYGLSTVQNKNSLLNLYLNENNLTDVLDTVEEDKTYGYKLPLIEGDNVINLSYIDGYRSLERLVCGYLGNISVTGDNNYSSNPGLHYLVGIDKKGNEIGLTSLGKLKEINFEFCDIFDVDKLKKFEFEDLTRQVLKIIKLLGNKNFKNTQIKWIEILLNNSEHTLDGVYEVFLDTNKVTLDFNNKDLEDLSFLEGNTVTKTLSLYNNKRIDDSQTKYIGGMTQLENLNLDWCDKITNFSFLVNLTNLKYLYLDGTKVTVEDLKSLTCKNKILSMSLYLCTNLNDVNFLGEFPNFGKNGGRLDLRNWSINEKTDLSILNSKNFSSLLIQFGDLTSCQDAISRFRNEYGTHLMCSTALLRQIESCNQITYFRMSSGREDSMENVYKGTNDSLNLNGCTNLSEIYFMRTSIENLSLTGCSSLSKLTIIDMGAGVRWIPSNLSKNTNLIYLKLDKNYLIQTDLENLINNLTPVYSHGDGNIIESGAPNLNEIILSRNNFVSLAPFASLAGKTKDFSLDVSNNSLIDLTGIEDLIQMTSLNIGGNVGITNIKPILDLKSKEGNRLKSITITGCSQITDNQKLELKNTGLEVKD